MPDLEKLRPVITMRREPGMLHPLKFRVKQGFKVDISYNSGIMTIRNAENEIVRQFAADAWWCVDYDNTDSHLT